MRDAFPPAQPRPRVGPTDARALVLGLGRDDRGDDGCGLDVLRSLRGRVPDGVRLLEVGGDLTTLLEVWADQPFVIAVDAVRSGRPPGTVHRIEVGDQPLPSPLGATSTHGFSLGQAVALGQTLGRFPRRLLIYGIEADSFGPGVDRTPAVAQAVGRTVQRIVDELILADASGGPA